MLKKIHLTKAMFAAAELLIAHGRRTAYGNISEVQQKWRLQGWHMSKLKIVACFICTLAVGPAIAAENLLKNPGFEDGEKFWNRVSGDVRIAAGDGYQGSMALVWENEESARHLFPEQFVELEPGRVYHFTALVKKDRFSGNDSDIYVGIEWNLRSGQWGGSCYGNPVDDNGILRDGWVRFEGTTAPMPADVGKACFILATAKTSVGRLRFDNVTLEGREVKYVEFLTTDAYRNTISCEEVHFLAALHLDTVKHALADYTAGLVYRTVKGETVTIPADTLTAEEAVFSLDGRAICKGSQLVRFEVRRAGLEKPIGEASIRLTRLERPLRRRVTYDASRRMLHDGKPFFPIGMYTGRMSEEDLEIYRRSPFNFATQYGGMTMWDLNRWEKIGVLVAADVRSLIYGYDYSAKSRFKTLSESQEALRGKYAEIGDSPALAMWYLNDEAPVSHAQNVAEVNAFLHEIDPERATLTCLCHPKTVKSFLPSFDFLAVDTYPIGAKSGGTAIGSVYDRQVESKVNMHAMRPHWFIPQTFNWGWCRSDEEIRRFGITDLRMPNRAELGNMYWQGIAAGANGILAYSFSSMRRHMKEDEFAMSWADVCAVAQEIRDLESVLLAEDRPIEKGLAGSIVARAWRLDGMDWYLIVNRTREAAKGCLPLGAKALSLKTVLGTGVTLAADGDALVCRFAPLGYTFVGVNLKK